MTSVIVLSYYFFLSVRFSPRDDPSSLHSSMIRLQERMLTRIEAILTQLVFDHALRMRMKAEVIETSGSGGTTAAATPDTASLIDSGSAQGAHGDADIDETTLGGSSAIAADSGSTQGKQKSRGAVESSKSGDKKDDLGKETPTDTGDGRNVVGKINNLITTDLETITSGRDILQLSTSRG